MSFEFEEKVEEKKDWTPYLWAAVVVLFVAMAGAMFFSRGTKLTHSTVVARHILFACDAKDVADRTRALELAKEVRQRILNGENFGKMAAQYSKDPTTASTGGLLPASARGSFESGFEAYVWTAPLNQISEPVPTGYGFHLIEVLERNIHESETYELDLDRRAVREVNKKNIERLKQIEKLPSATPVEIPDQPKPAPAPAPAAEAPAAPAAPAAEAPAAPAAPAAQ